MADEDRVVFPDEVEEVKAKATNEQENKEEEVKEEEQKPEEVDETEESNEVQTEEGTSGIKFRNMIVVPGNCPPGFRRGADGVCREVF